MTLCRGLAYVFALVASALTLNAQGLCELTSGVPPIVRVEGLTELVGDLVVTCRNLIPNGGRRVDLELILNTSVTSRILDPATGQTESLLLLDEPAPGTLTICPNPAGCASGANAFRGEIPRSNSVLFRGIPLDGTGTDRTFRITNVRANAAQIGLSATPIPSTIIAFVTARPGILPINNPQQIVAYVHQGLYSAAESAGPRKVITFTEGFPTAFRPRVRVGVRGIPVLQDLPGQAVLTESGFYPGGRIGLADFGTRLKAVFGRIPADVIVTVPLQLTDAATGATATLVNSETGAFSARASGDLTATNGIAAAVWEITRAADPSSFSSDRLSGEITARFTTRSGSPDLNALVMSGSFAPASTEMIPSVVAPIPRFVPKVPGDVTGDGRVQCDDLLFVRFNLGRRSTVFGFDARADVVADGVIDIRDLAFVSQQLPLGTRCY